MSSSATGGRVPTADASPTKSDEYGELDFVVVDEVDNLPPPASPTAQGSSSEVTVDANSNVTAPRVYHRREKKALALSLIDDIALQGGTPRKSPGSVADKLIPGRGDSANSPPCASPSPSIAIPSAANAGATPALEPGKEEVFAPEKRRRQGPCKMSSKAGLGKRRAPHKLLMPSDQVLSISLPGYNWLEKKLHDVSKPGMRSDSEPSTMAEDASALRNRSSCNEKANHLSETSVNKTHVTAQRTPTNVPTAAESCNSNSGAKVLGGDEGEVIELTDDEEPLYHWSDCVIVDDEVASEASNDGDNEPILLPRIDTSPPEMPQLQQPSSAKGAGEESNESVSKEEVADSDQNSKSHETDFTYTDSNKSVNQTYDQNTKHPVGESETKKQEDSQDDVVLLEVSPAKDSDGFYSFNPYAYKASRTTDDNFIDLCSRQNEETTSPINLLTSSPAGDVMISQLNNNIHKIFDIAPSSQATTQFGVDQLRATAVSKAGTFPQQRLLAAALDSSVSGFGLDRADLSEDKQVPQINETCQLLYRKIQSIVKSKSPEVAGSKAETPHGNACRSLQDAINTAMVKAMSEDFEEEFKNQAKAKMTGSLSGGSESVTTRQVPQHSSSSSGQTHLPPKKRALCIDDSAGASNVSNRSPPLSKRRKTISRIQKVRPILLTEGEDSDKCSSDEVTIVKPHNLDPAAEHAWPGPSVPNRSGPPDQTVDVTKPNVVDLACEQEKHRVLKSSMFSPPKRVVIKKKVGRRPGVQEVPPPMFPSTASPKAPFKMDSPSTVHAVAEHASGDYFFGDNDEARFVQLKDNTVAFKEIRALQEPYSSSNRYTSHVDLTGSRLSSSPAHFQPGISQSAALASPFHKVTWPGPKAAGLEQQPYPTSAAMPSRSPVSPQNSFAGPAGFFECLSPRVSGASRTWTSPKPKVGPDISSDSNAGVGHAFHPVTPSNKLLPYPPYHPSKSCAQSNDQHRSVIKPQLGALQHPMVPVAAPLRPTTQIPFGLPVSHSSAPTPTQQPLHNPYRAGWVPSRTPYSTRDTLVHYDPHHFIRRPSEQYSAVSQGQMLSTRFAPTASTPMYQMPRHTLPRGLAPDVSQAYWPTTQHALAPPFSKQ